MVNTVKKIRARRDILKITKKQDYFIISDIYHGDSDCERKSHLLTSLLKLNDVKVQKNLSSYSKFLPNRIAKPEILC
jgi:hypothetical protein